jgi:enoyl-CoA hydratase/carnithine racemase
MTIPPAPTVRVSRDAAVVTVTINREHKLNELDYATIDALLQAFEELEADDSVRAVILTAAGDRAFSAGAGIPVWPAASPAARSRRCGTSSGAARGWLIDRRPGNRNAHQLCSSTFSFLPRRVAEDAVDAR